MVDIAPPAARAVAFDARLPRIPSALRVEPATPDDRPAVHAAYTDARAIRRAQGAILCPEFGDASILAEIAEGRLYRVLVRAVVGVFSAAD